MTETITKHVRAERVMGTVVTFDVRGAEPPARAIDDAVRLLHEVDAKFSTYRSDSAVSRYDRGELIASVASDDLRWVVGRCAELRSEPAGYFDAYANGTF